MGATGKIKLGAFLLANRDVLGRWYLRNRLRTATLSFERAHLPGTSRFARGLTFKLTWACNLRCKMCRFAQNGAVSAGPGDALPLEVWTSVVDDVSRFRPYISLTGGEPLMYPHTEALIRHVKARRMRCTLTTNGTLLAKRAASLMDAPPDILVVSLDGPRDIHNSVRGSASAFDRAAEGLAAVQELKGQRGQRTPILVLNCAVTAHNYQHVDAMLDIAHELGVSVLNYQHQWSLTPAMVGEHNAIHGDCHRLSWEELGGAEPPSVDESDVAETFDRIRGHAAALRNGVLVTFHPGLSDSEVHRWYADPRTWVQRRPAVCAWLNTSILPNGDVEPCPGVVCGNISEEKLSGIWNGARFRAHRRRLAAAGDFPICVRCCSYFRRD